ncbi:MAG TPA: 3-hydroxyacyl-CoA dehydrogenase family protein [Pseudonocardiaceae bacterium]|nr:3-hydroxyacyl-CoA dehydrogenase family protein [Pseudonocardiaceae bacterium]
MSGRDPRTVAVVGGGTMGLGIAQVFRFAGLRVVLCDADEQTSRAAKQNLAARTERQVAGGLRPPDHLDQVADVEVVFPATDAVADADVVIEAVPEVMALKQRLLAEISRATRPDTIIATNTSSYPIDQLAEPVHLPDRFLGWHWFGPPEWVPCVEVIRGPATSGDVVGRSRQFLTAVGKRPAEVSNAPGFVANRLQMALFAEAIRCVEEGVASPAEIDEIARGSFGFRLPHYGPFAIADMAGLDTYIAVYECLHDAYGDRFTPPDRLRQLVAEGHYGTKNGHGFADYTPDDQSRLMSERDARYAAMNEFVRGRDHD